MKKLLLSLALACSLFAGATVTVGTPVIVDTVQIQKEINSQQEEINNQQEKLNFAQIDTNNVQRAINNSQKEN